MLLPHDPPERLVELARLAESRGYDHLWLADERFFREVYTSLALCAMRTVRIRLGPCVTDPYSRHLALTAMAIATLDGIRDSSARASPSSVVYVPFSVGGQGVTQEPARPLSLRLRQGLAARARSGGLPLDALERVGPAVL